MLQVSTTGHGRIAITLRQPGEQPAYCLDVTLDQRQGGADLQDHRGVHDVLGGGAPMHVAPGLAAGFGQLLHQRQDRVTDDLGFVLHQRQIQRFESGLGGNLFGSIGRDHTTAGLGVRQRDLNFDVTPDQRLVGEHFTHIGGAEHVAEQCRVKNGSGHAMGPKCCYWPYIFIMSVHNY